MLKVMIFIDGSNLYRAMKKHLNRTDLDYAAFARFLTSPDRLIRAYFYNSPPPPPMDAAIHQAYERFKRRLERTDYFEVRLGRIVEREFECLDANGQSRVDSDGNKVKCYTFIQKGVDMRLGVDLVAASAGKHFDRGILVSADGDFKEAVEKAKSFGAVVEVAAFHDCSQALLDVCDKSITLTPRNMKSLLMRKRLSR
jgi:uncharacterized LabA/DUF88 family protein